MTQKRLPASFRDPQGFVFEQDGRILRAVAESFKDSYEMLMSSGLYEELVREHILVAHEETTLNAENSYKVLAPQKIPFISYPYEWSFGQLKDAALLTLDAANRALSHGMILKDASAYNVQFLGSRPILLDTLSFEIHKEGTGWMAYRQFCEHFLAPLTLMSKGDLRANKMLQTFIDGLPLDYSCSMLSGSTFLNPSLLIHIYLHARAQHAFAGKDIKEVKKKSMPKQSVLALLDNLIDCVNGLKIKESKTTWSHYYTDTNYSESSAKEKERIVNEMIELSNIDEVWDIGANNGHFSRLAASAGKRVISMDLDPLCVELNYRKTKEEKQNILPLLIDLSAPSPAIGWNNKERMSLTQRGPAPLGMALALIHHLAIGNNVPLPMVAEYFQSLCKQLIIEFVPKDDSQVQRLLSSREDIYPDYNEAGFRKAFAEHFDFVRELKIEGSSRTMFLLKRK